MVDRNIRHRLASSRKKVTTILVLKINIYPMKPLGSFIDFFHFKVVLILLYMRF